MGPGGQAWIGDEGRVRQISRAADIDWRDARPRGVRGIRRERGIILRNIYPLSPFAKSSLRATPLIPLREEESFLPQPHLFLYLHSLSLSLSASSAFCRRSTVLRPRIGISNNSLAHPFVYSTITIIDRYDCRLYRVDNTRGCNNRFVEIPKEILFPPLPRDISLRLLK